jgi:hypothetical protein
MEKSDLTAAQQIAQAVVISTARLRAVRSRCGKRMV